MAWEWHICEGVSADTIDETVLRSGWKIAFCLHHKGFLVLSLDAAILPGGEMRSVDTSATHHLLGLVTMHLAHHLMCPPPPPPSSWGQLFSMGLLENVMRTCADWYQSG